MLTPREIDELAEHQKRQFSRQRDDDIRDKDIIRQKHVIDAQKDKKLQVRPVGTGYGKLVSAQNRSYLSAAPFIAFTAPRDTLKAYAEELEAAIQQIWGLSGAWLAWLRSIRDVVDVGRGWLLIHHLPKLWTGPEWEQGDSSDREFTDRLTELKLDNFPVVARHVDVRNTWPIFTLKRELDQVVEIRQMTARQLEEAYNSRFGLEEDTERVRVIVYADHTHMRTVIAKHGGMGPFGGVPAQEATAPWEHGMGMNPYVLMEAPPLAENDEGVVWEGSVAALRHLIPEMDGALTDIRHSGRKSARAQRVFELDLESRREQTPKKSNADLIPITPDGDIVLSLGEKVNLLGAAQANPDLAGFLGIARSFTQENAVRASLLGIAENASESGVEFNTKSQIAQNDFGPAIDFLSVAAENVARHFLSSIIAFSETFADIGLTDTIPLSFVDSKGISKKTNLVAKDLKGWDKRLQAKISAQIPINQNQQIMTARLAADPQGGVMSLETAMELYTPIANPQEERRQRDLDKMKTALVEAWVQAAQQQAAKIAAQPANSDILAQDFAALPPSQQQAVQMAAQAQGQTVPEARGQANTVREGMVQVSGR